MPPGMDPPSVGVAASEDHRDLRVRAAENRLAALSLLLSKLDDAAQNDGLVAVVERDTHQAQLVQARLGMASSLFTALRAKHAATASHALRVALGVSSWATAQDMASDERDSCEIAALLHDIGKMGVADSVLTKPGKLSAEEMLVMDRSRHLGCEILSGCCGKSSLLDLVFYVPAWFDGSKDGYDLRGTKLPLGSRMIAIVDAFDAMTTDHIYRPAKSRERAVAELCQFAGTQFDPDLVREFCDFVTRDHVQLHSQVAQRWLQQLCPETANPFWNLRQPIPVVAEPLVDFPFYERLFESLSDGVVFVDAQRCIQQWNHAAERITGILGTGIVGKQWTAALLTLRDEHSKLVAESECPVMQAMQTGHLSLKRYTVDTPSQAKRAVDIQIAPVIGLDGLPRGATIVMHDASSQITLEERVQSLHERATRDPLTKAANRAEFNRVLPEFIATHLAQSKPCSMIICDIDHFKKINDSFGHPAGDAALVLFASVLIRHARAADLVVRYGGEEFVVLCVECDNAAATRRAEEIRRIVASTPMASLANQCITASFGVTEIQGGDNPETFLARADRALLKAKDSGRNMVVQFGSGMGAARKAKDGLSWLGWFHGTVSEALLERTLVTVVPLKVTTEKLRGFVSDHRAQVAKVSDNCVCLTIDSLHTALNRRTSDRAMPFRVELTFDERELPVEGRSKGMAIHTIIDVVIRPKRQRDRRQRDALERARQLLISLQSYLMAEEMKGVDQPAEPMISSPGVLQSAKRLLNFGRSS